MVVIILLIISVLINCILCIALYRKNKQIELIQKIRVGYEKRCNSFKIRYAILSSLENNTEITYKIKKLMKPVYIYGGGIIGKKLINILNKDFDIKVLGFIEGKELENNKSFEKQIDKNAVIIVTPVFDYDSIAKLLCKHTDSANIISIDEIL